jgi:hypothetical protein
MPDLAGYRADRATTWCAVPYVHGGQVRRFTKVRNPRVLPTADVARLYTRQLDIELGVALVKRELELHLWWSSTELVIDQQPWGSLHRRADHPGLRMETPHGRGVRLRRGGAALVRCLPIVAAQGRTRSRPSSSGGERRGSSGQLGGWC